MKVSELTGALLDYWVARVEGQKVRTYRHGDGSIGGLITDHRPFGNGGYSPSTDWAQGGPIIEREFIAVFRGDGEWGAEVRHIDSPHWIDTSVYHEVTGPTPLIAAMRAYVTSKFGDEVNDKELA